jgi:hypothetical protein
MKNVRAMYLMVLTGIVFSCTRVLPSSQSSPQGLDKSGHYLEDYWTYINNKHQQTIAPNQSNPHSEKKITGQKDGIKFEIDYSKEKFRYWSLSVEPLGPEKTSSFENKKSLGAKILFKKKSNESGPVIIIQWKSTELTDWAFWDPERYEQLKNAILDGKKKGIFDFLRQSAQITQESFIIGLVDSLLGTLEKYQIPAENEYKEIYAGVDARGAPCSVEIIRNPNYGVHQVNISNALTDSFKSHLILNVIPYFSTKKMCLNYSFPAPQTKNDDRTSVTLIGNQPFGSYGLNITRRDVSHTGTDSITGIQREFIGRVGLFSGIGCETVKFKLCGDKASISSVYIEASGIILPVGLITLYKDGFECKNLTLTKLIRD